MRIQELRNGDEMRRTRLGLLAYLVVCDVIIRGLGTVIYFNFFMKKTGGV